MLDPRAPSAPAALASSVREGGQRPAPPAESAACTAFPTHPAPRPHPLGAAPGAALDRDASPLTPCPGHCPCSDHSTRHGLTQPVVGICLHLQLRLHPPLHLCHLCTNTHVYYDTCLCAIHVTRYMCHLRTSTHVYHITPVHSTCDVSHLRAYLCAYTTYAYTRVSCM